MRRLKTNIQSGFTLIELILVTAIAGLLVVIVFAGQQQVRARAQFDSDIGSVIQEFAYARNYSNSNVNGEGGGNGIGTCSPQPCEPFVVAGAALELHNVHPPNKLVEVEPHYCQPGTTSAGSSPTAACITTLDKVPGDISLCPRANTVEGECFEDEFDDNTNIRLKVVGGINKVKIIYLNTGDGVYVCQPMLNDMPGIHTACATPLTAPYTFTIKNSDGFTADIQVGTDGYAHRLN
jgi:prepilin-type N-terminal cleavage/methylation domain-containing protein